MEQNNYVLGTAQLGMRYGIANKAGQPNQKEATALVRTAWQSGIREFDTAQGYLNSEKVLGVSLRSVGVADQARIITKLDPKIDHTDEKYVRAALKESIIRLGCRRLFGVMLHDENLLDRWDSGVGQVMQKFMDEGLTENLGVSVYSPAKALQAIEASAISLIQIPANILDRRFENAGVFEKAQKKRKKIYLRSVFLQGLIIMDANDLPVSMKHVAPVIQKIEDLVIQTRLSRREIALSFVETAYPDSKLVIGAETQEQVRQNIQTMGKPLPPHLVGKIKQTFADIGDDILNPANWPVS